MLTFTVSAVLWSCVRLCAVVGEPIRAVARSNAMPVWTDRLHMFVARLSLALSVSRSLSVSVSLCVSLSLSLSLSVSLSVSLFSLRPEPASPRKAPRGEPADPEEQGERPDWPACLQRRQAHVIRLDRQASGRGSNEQ